MLFHVNSSSGVPIYVQIEAQVKNAVAAGALRRDQSLPSVRKLATELGINPNTVARAYQELERDGVIAVEGIQLGLTDKEIMETVQEELERLGVHK
jgi:DNA-binding transcriptional regulator YhcF (GntR family)